MAYKALCLALALVCAASAAPEGRLVGGTPTTIEEFPYIVALTYTYPGPGITVQRCVGGLISSWHVLTSAFCFTGANLGNFEVRAGSTESLSGGTVTTIRDVTKHPDYQESPLANDIAVVLLQTPFAITNNINVLFLPPQNTFIPDGQSVKVVSWGFETMTGPQLQTLKKVYLKKVSLDECSAGFENVGNVAVSDSVICASEEGAVGTCRGDSGAPMVIDQVVVGISSYFHECGDDLPDVFTRTDRFTDWIVSVATAPNDDDVTSVRVKSVNY
ncbi:trypsin, alkaline B-like [Papilio machaon]|uniref:trypsin, alkaline B-like n=1 Tax=Papilio machaon TaxID=76193 RepID=UPI001E663B36|nr:trypsin, alkaline B-like [Papilio machaon]